MPHVETVTAAPTVLADVRRARDPSEAANVRHLTQTTTTSPPRSIEAAFQEHLDAIYNYCYRRTASWSEAEDLAATVFLEAWRSRDRARVVDDTLLPWLYGIASNVCRHHDRSFVRGSRAVRRLRAVPEAGPQDPADDVAAHDWLTQAVASLPARDQDAFVLVCWQDLTYQQAAQALSVPVGTIRSRVHRARRHLQRLHHETTPDHSLHPRRHRDD